MTQNSDQQTNKSDYEVKLISRIREGLRIARARWTAKAMPVDQNSTVWLNFDLQESEDRDMYPKTDEEKQSFDRMIRQYHGPCCNLSWTWIESKTNTIHTQTITRIVILRFGIILGDSEIDSFNPSST